MPIPLPSCRMYRKTPLPSLPDGLQRERGLFSAVAAQAAEDITGQALAVDTHERRLVRRDTSPTTNATCSSLSTMLLYEMAVPSPNSVGSLASSDAVYEPLVLEAVGDDVGD